MLCAPSQPTSQAHERSRSLPSAARRTTRTPSAAGLKRSSSVCARELDARRQRVRLEQALALALRNHQRAVEDTAGATEVELRQRPAVAEHAAAVRRRAGGEERLHGADALQELQRARPDDQRLRLVGAHGGAVDGEAAQPQPRQQAGEGQADRAGAGDQDVVVQADMRRRVPCGRGAGHTDLRLHHQGSAGGRRFRGACPRRPR